jgi:hypothetical protein
MAEFEIGETLETMTNLEELTTPVVPPKSAYLPYARTVNLGNGGKRGVGSPMAVWDFAVLSLAERNQLKTFCTGASADVYIRTKLNDDTYADFSAKMIWADGIEDRWYGEKKNFSITFRNLILIPEGS